ncbi:MAG: endolytic transglycosylase MltG [Patescibacteria group bacterium]
MTRKFFWTITLVAMVVFAGCAFAIWAGFETFVKAPSASAQMVAFEIVAGESVGQISSHLKAQHLIGSKFVFKTYVKLIGAESAFKAGNYEFGLGTNYATLTAILTGAGAAQEITLTIPEGYTLVQIGEVVQAKLSILPEDWQAATGVDSAFEGTMPLLSSKPDTVDLEGYLFPDTYRFARGATASDVAKKMLDTMASKISTIAPVFSEDPDQPFPQNIHEILTLASIVEREVRTDVDRPLVSGIFWNRLQIGMALQADSTINYVTGKKTPGVSLEDLQIDSPYNTYKYPGLPPGPISNPGLASIQAAANPGDVDYFYFLTTDDGEVMYAETHDEHVANKARYR